MPKNRDKVDRHHEVKVTIVFKKYKVFHPSTVKILNRRQVGWITGNKFPPDDLPGKRPIVQYYEIKSKSTLESDGTILIKISHKKAKLGTTPELWSWESGEWVDITTSSNEIDDEDIEIIGETRHLSPFGIR